MVGQFLLEHFEGQLEIIELLEVTDGDAEGVDEHGDKGVLQVQVLCNVVGEPHDYVREGKDPDDAQYEREGVEVVVLLRERTRDGDVLSVGQRHEQDVLEDGLQASARFRALNGERLLVDGLIDQLVNDTLRNALGLAHDLLLEEDLLPVDLVRLFIILQLLAINSNGADLFLLGVKLGPLHIVVLLGFVGGSVQVQILLAVVGALAELL